MSYDGFDVSNKTCLITGGTSGIGLAIAKGLAAAGAHVVVGSSNSAKVESARVELGDGHESVQLNVTDEASVDAAVNHVNQKVRPTGCCGECRGNHPPLTGDRHAHF